MLSFNIAAQTIYEIHPDAKSLPVVGVGIVMMALALGGYFAIMRVAAAVTTERLKQNAE
jgi:hypothetical protein